MENTILEINKAYEYATNNDFANAIEIYEKNIENITDLELSIFTLKSYAYCLSNIGNFDKAIEIYLELNSTLDRNTEDYYKNNYNLSFNYLHNNRWLDGMKSYHYRIFEPYKLNIPYSENYLDLKNKNVIIFNEQGLGDEFLFANSLNWLSENTKKLKYQVYPENLEFFQKYYPNIEFFSDRSITKDDLIDFDIFSYSGSVYSSLFIISPEYNVIDSFRKLTSTKNVGVCWSSNINGTFSSLKNIDYSFIEKLKNEFPDINFISLQYDLDINNNPKTPYKNILETSEIIKDLDFVISVDTVVANLSCFMNKKTFVLIDKYIDWRWKYPTYDNYELSNINNISAKIKNYYNKFLI